MLLLAWIEMPCVSQAKWLASAFRVGQLVPSSRGQIKRDEFYKDAEHHWTGSKGGFELSAVNQDSPRACLNNVLLLTVVVNLMSSDSAPFLALALLPPSLQHSSPVSWGWTRWQSWALCHLAWVLPHVWHDHLLRGLAGWSLNSTSCRMCSLHYCKNTDFKKTCKSICQNSTPQGKTGCNPPKILSHLTIYHQRIIFVC